MSGQTARWRSRYSCRRSGRTCSAKQTRSVSADPGVFESEQAGDLLHLVRDVPDAQCHGVGRAGLAPTLEEPRRREREAQAAVRVADPKRLAGDGLALG